MGQLWGLVSILNSEVSRRENQKGPFRYRVAFRHRTPEKVRVKKLRSANTFYSSPVTVVGTNRNTAVSLELIAISSSSSSTSMTLFSTFSDVNSNVRRLMMSPNQKYQNAFEQFHTVIPYNTHGRPGTRACTYCSVTSSILCDVISPVQSILYRHNQLYLEGISEFIAIVMIVGVSK